MCNEALSGLIAVMNGNIPHNVVNPSVFNKK
jgi:hypothetical protein